MRRHNRRIAFLLVASLWLSQMLYSYAEEENDTDNNLLKATYKTVKSEQKIEEEEVASVSDNNLEEQESQQENPVLQLEVPTRLPFMIDPYEIGGEGQIYSADFLLTNKSTFPIDIDITKISYILNDKSIKPSGEPIPADTTSKEKDIYLFIKWAEKEIGDDGVIVNEYVDDSHEASNAADVLTDEEGWQSRIIHLEPGADIMFTMDGSVNAMAEKPWKQEDISIELAYVCGMKIEKEESVSENVLTVSENIVTVSENIAESVNENKTENTSISENKALHTEKEENSEENPDGTVLEANTEKKETKKPTSETSPETTTQETTPTTIQGTTPATSTETITSSDTEKRDTISTNDDTNIPTEANKENTQGTIKSGVDVTTSE